MKPQVNAQSLLNGCLYPFEGLSPEQGYPSMADFIVESGHSAKGRGVMALRHFQRITRMCRVSGQLVHAPQLHSVQLAAGIHVYDPYFCGRLRHSCDPNVFLDMSELWLWALQDITRAAHCAWTMSAPKPACCASLPVNAARPAAVAGSPVTMNSPAPRGGFSCSDGIAMASAERPPGVC